MSHDPKVGRRWRSAERALSCDVMRRVRLRRIFPRTGEILIEGDESWCAKGLVINDFYETDDEGKGLIS